MYYKTVIGEKVYLSPMRSEDADTYARWLNDFDIARFLKKKMQVISLDAEKAIMKEFLQPDNYTFGIIDKDTDKLIGNCGFNEIDMYNRRAMIGIFIGDKEYLGKGYGTDAITLLLDFGFNLLNLHNIWLGVFAYNERAIKSYLKAGFKEIGRRREAKCINGKYYDEVMMDIIATEFESPYISKHFE